MNRWPTSEQAAWQALARAGVADELDLLIVATDTPEYVSPYRRRAATVGATRVDFDLNAARAGSR
jgi:3-oxoacyl-[acyl-carrier-protein] synthase III